MTKLSPTELIKTKSQGLRGTLADSLKDEHTGALRDDDQILVKFHGIYQQDDRDRREERAEKKLENLYSFMIRLRIPGGLIRADQWVAAHHIAGQYSTGIIKITTRQTLQLHGVLKRHLKPTLQAFDQLKLDSIAACGDVNRNVVCSAHPASSPLHAQVHAYADTLSTLFLPTTRAYYEIWLDEERLNPEQVEADPLYQDHYLPRKFKIAIAIPSNNDVDVFANDVGLIAIEENGSLSGFNLVVGGGLGTTHGNDDTYPRLGTVLGFVRGDEQVHQAVYNVATIQRDFGNRSDRKFSRLKYTLDRMGVEAFKTELEKRCGFVLEPARPFVFTRREDDYGWHQDASGHWHFTLFVENGRVADDDQVPLKTGLLTIAQTHKCNFRFTCHQNVILADIAPVDKEMIQELLAHYGLLAHQERSSATRKNAMACVAFNTCPLALAEAQRYLPALIDKIDVLQAKHGLAREPIILRMTGCPNGCARPYVAEIGLIGTAYGRYNLLLGGDREGYRLNKLYKPNLDETAILAELDELFGRFTLERWPGEGFGDFIQRIGLIA